MEPRASAVALFYLRAVQDNNAEHLLYICEAG